MPNSILSLISSTVKLVNQQVTRLTRPNMALLLAASCCLTPGSVIAEKLSEEDKVKTALIYRLPKFVNWPDKVFENKPNEFRICIIGKDTLQSALEALKGRKVSSRSIVIKSPNLSNLKSTNCHLLFISSSEKERIPQILNRLDKLSTLTISDTPSFAENGGHIEIYRQGKHLAFRINNHTAKRAGLELAAPLLDMATIVKR